MTVPHTPRAFDRRRAAIAHFLAMRQAKEIRFNDERRPLRHAALAFLPAVPLKASPVFDHPIQPVGAVTLAVLHEMPPHHTGSESSSAHRDDHDDHWPAQGRPHRPVLAFRGMVAWYDPSSGTTRWDSLQFAFDLSEPFAWDGGLDSLSLGAFGLIRTGLDMDRTLRWVTRNGGRPILPPTLLAIPMTKSVKPCPSSAVVRYAEQAHVPWLEAWRDLYQRTTVIDPVFAPGYRLVDRTLCPPCMWDHQAFHDLRRCLARPFRNPARFYEPGAGVSRQRLRECLRLDLAPDLATWASDADVDRALDRPGQPLCIEGMSSVEAWEVGMPARRRAFRVDCEGQVADLHHPTIGHMPACGLGARTEAKPTRATHDVGRHVA